MIAEPTVPGEITFDDWFTQLTGEKCPLHWMKNSLEKIGEDLWATSKTGSNYEIIGFPKRLLMKSPGATEYTLVGFAGYGSNSYALYLTHFAGNKSFFLRLPFGGAYMDEDATALYIFKTLKAFQELNSDRFWNIAFTIESDMSEESLSLRLVSPEGYISDSRLEAKDVYFSPERIADKILSHADNLKMLHSRFHPYLRGMGTLNKENILLLSEKETLLGRSIETLACQNVNISRRHAMIRRESNGFLIEDLNSTNGTTLNGQRLEAKKCYTLKRGDNLNLAGLLLKFCP